MQSLNGEICNNTTATTGTTTNLLYTNQIHAYCKYRLPCGRCEMTGNLCQEEEYTHVSTPQQYYTTSHLDVAVSGRFEHGQEAHKLSEDELDNEISDLQSLMLNYDSIGSTTKSEVSTSD